MFYVAENYWGTQELLWHHRLYLDLNLCLPVASFCKTAVTRYTGVLKKGEGGAHYCVY